MRRTQPFCRAQLDKALVQGMAQNHVGGSLDCSVPQVIFTFLIWRAASNSFTLASSMLSLAPCFSSFCSFSKHPSKGLPFAAPTSFFTCFKSFTILLTLRTASFFGKAFPTAERTSASATCPSLPSPLSEAWSPSSSSPAFQSQWCFPLAGHDILQGLVSQALPSITIFQQPCGSHLHPVGCFYPGIVLSLVAMLYFFLSPCHRLPQGKLPLLCVQGIPSAGDASPFHLSQWQWADKSLMGSSHTNKCRGKMLF